LKQSTKTILVWATLIAFFVAFYQTMRTGIRDPRKIEFSEFINRALPQPDDPETSLIPGTSTGSINSLIGGPSDTLAHLQSADLPPSGVKRIELRGEEIQGVLADDSRFKTRGNIEPYQKELIARGVAIRYEKADGDAFWLSILGTWLPMLLLIFLVIFFFRQLQSGSGKALSFGKSRHRMMSDSQNKVTFKDVAGIEEAREELVEIIEFLKDPKRFTRLGGRIPKGVLLMGPPGTGKTLLAKAVAGEAEVPFFTISGSEFVEMFVGVGASRVRDLFDQAKKQSPCIIFVDEIDAVGRHRGAGVGGGHDEREQTLNQLLVEMDGFESQSGVIIMAATNRPDVLDPALLRPGRFDRRIVVPRPDIKGREEILKVHTRRTPLSRTAKLSIIARATPGFSGADLENLINEAALIAARHNKDVVGMDDLNEAKDKVLMGAERRSIVLSDNEKSTTAWHEGGHALVAKLIDGPTDPIHKVTIIPRGASLGLTQQIPEEDRHSYSGPYILNRICIAMGGRIAEELKFNVFTTGAGQDIEQATGLARKMVCEWGMSSLGPLAFGKKEEPVFMGMEMNHHQSSYSEDTAQRIDQEIQKIVQGQYDRAKKILTKNRDTLDKVAESLLEYESLDGEEMSWVMDGKDLSVLHEQRILEESEKGPVVESGVDEESEETPENSVDPANDVPNPEPEPA